MEKQIKEKQVRYGTHPQERVLLFSHLFECGYHLTDPRHLSNKDEKEVGRLEIDSSTGMRWFIVEDGELERVVDSYFKIHL